MPEPRLVLVPDARAGQVALQAGLADGLALSTPTVRWMSLNDRLGATEQASPFAQPPPELAGRLGYGAVVFRKGDAQLRNAWDGALAEVLGSPVHLARVQPFGFTSTEAACVADPVPVVGP